MINNFIVGVASWHLVFKWAYQYYRASMLNSVMMCMSMVYNGLQAD